MAFHTPAPMTRHAARPSVQDKNTTARGLRAESIHDRATVLAHDAPVKVEERSAAGVMAAGPMLQIRDTLRVTAGRDKR